MKAAVISNFGETPRYEDIPDPVPGKDEILVTVKANVLENIEKRIAEGHHYMSKSMYTQFPSVVGNRGIGMTNDGRLVSFEMMRPPYGAYAEKAPIKKYTFVPDGVDAVTAAAIPPSARTCLLPLKYSAKFKEGETVLINGATGVTGKMAIQVAKLLGAGRIIATGRNEASFEQLKSLGADAVIDLKKSDFEILEALEREKGENGYDVILDFLWGRPAEVIMKFFVPIDMTLPKKPIRFVHIGSSAGAEAKVSGEMLRTSGLELLGLGVVTLDNIEAVYSQIWGWLKEGKLQMEIEQLPLADIETAWKKNDLRGKRIVIIP